MGLLIDLPYYSRIGLRGVMEICFQKKTDLVMYDSRSRMNWGYASRY